MSAVRQYNYMRTAVVDGRPVLVKRCRGCEEEKECSDDSASGFSVAFRGRITVSWRPQCKVCTQREKRERLRERLKDPEYARERRERSTRISREWRNRPENYERVAEARARYWASIPEERKQEYLRRQREKARPSRRKRPAEYVPNEGLRAAAERAVEREVVGMDALSRVVFPKEAWPSLRLRRALGILPYWKDGREYVQARVSVEVAVRIVRALDLDPVDFGV